MVQQAKEEDVSEWLGLAKEVGELFGKDMANDPDFLSWLRRNIDRGSAYCIRRNGKLAGAMAFRQGRINWLAVREQSRNRGVGRTLVQFAQNAGLPEIRVTTFGLDHPHKQAVATRAFFFAQGFRSTNEPPEASPDGTPREVLLWRRT